MDRAAGRSKSAVARLGSCNPADPREESSCLPKTKKTLLQTEYPDRGGAASAAAMVELNDAYEILKDPGQRAAYDARLRTLRDERRREADADAAFAESLRPRGK